MEVDAEATSHNDIANSNLYQKINNLATICFTHRTRGFVMRLVVKDKIPTITARVTPVPSTGRHLRRDTREARYEDRKESHQRGSLHLHTNINTCHKSHSTRHGGPKG
jgi:hypothetical protein